MTGGPILYRWDGEAMTPATQRFAREADKQFVVGEEYPLIVHEHRSAASHKHYFAAISDAWESLPESMAGEFPTSEHLRKRALIMAGYRDERSIVAASKAEAGDAPAAASETASRGLDTSRGVARVCCLWSCCCCCC